MHYKTLFSLFLFSHFWQPVLLGAANHEEKINELLGMPYLETLKIHRLRNIDDHLSNAIIAKIPTSGPINEEQKQYIKLLPICFSREMVYEKHINSNIKFIMKELSGTLNYNNILQLTSNFNFVITKEIVNYLNKNKDNDNNKAYLKLLLQCDFNVESYKEYIKNNIELIMEGLTDNLTNNDILINLQHNFNHVISREIFNYIIDTKNYIISIKEGMLFLLCEVALFDPKTSQKYKTILERSWVTKNILKARNQLLCLLRNSTENTEETAKEITSAKNNLIDLIKKNYIKRDGQSNKTFRNAGVLITLATGGSLVCLSWNNKDCLKKPYIKNILAVACLGGLTLTVVSQFIHMKEKNKDLAEIEKCYHKKP